MHSIKYVEIQVFADPDSPDSVFLRENTGQLKPVFSHILYGDIFYAVLFASWLLKTFPHLTACFRLLN